MTLRIKELRKQRGITQTFIARQLNMSNAGYASIERGDIRLDIQRAAKIAKLLNVKIDDLFFEE